MKAIVTNGNMDIKLCDIPIPEIGEDEVLVKVSAVGICGSDIPRVLSNVCPVYPTILGHEFCGVIAKAGANVTNVKVGQRVAGIPLVPCFECERCKKGRYGQCKNFLFLGTKLPGGMAEYLKCNCKNVLPISDEVTDIQGAMFEPITVALHAVFAAENCLQNSCGVVGCGTIGLSIIQCLKALGAKKIVAVDIDDEKLQVAKQLGADEIINTKSGEDAICNLELATVFECVGAQPSIHGAVKMTGDGATVVLVGLPRKDVVLTPEIFDKISKMELILKSTWMSYSAPFPGKEWTTAEKLFSENKINTDLMLEKVIAMEDVVPLFNSWNDGAPIGKKTIIKSE